MNCADRMQGIDRRALLCAAAAAPFVQPGRERYRLDMALASADLEKRLAAGGNFDRELARFELHAQLLRERYNVFLWDGPTTARGYRHPSWAAL
ncbi:hypothetical protein Mpop_5135 [Methylorubrum populi BJ001]|jgi:hypothetical protein|uniref:Uncharacterized protein n=1 Tax=Methylorubrum populi (strain ATCC BAA-705 / NCIMB 13946 / BJ001) TaxID=441620 RepID=B1Z8S9_METPB|nr:hypothetical protein [Methylorubrum populi]ACB83231.1 hypothetical protein Mpop_5135 [Methylorubrum populi BJ001]